MSGTSSVMGSLSAVAITADSITKMLQAASATVTATALSTEFMALIDGVETDVDTAITAMAAYTGKTNDVVRQILANIQKTRYVGKEAEFRQHLGIIVLMSTVGNSMEDFKFVSQKAIFTALWQYWELTKDPKVEGRLTLQQIGRLFPRRRHLLYTTQIDARPDQYQIGSMGGALGVFYAAWKHFFYPGSAGCLTPAEYAALAATFDLIGLFLSCVLKSKGDAYTGVTIDEVRRYNALQAVQPTSVIGSFPTGTDLAGAKQLAAEFFAGPRFGKHSYKTVSPF